MIYREKYLKDHPEKPFNINTMCPWHYYYKDTTDCPADESGWAMSCEDCWNREIDEIVCPESLPMVDTWTWEEASPKHWILVDGTTGVCPDCHRQDHIDPLAKYCRYCGARLELEE